MLNEIHPGVILSEDLYLNTINPIINKHTKITAEHIKVLQAFGVRKIMIVDPIYKKDKETEDTSMIAFNSDEVLAEFNIEIPDFELEYNQAINSYKKEYLSWTSGTRPDIAKIRSIIIPLLEVFIDQDNLLSILGELSEDRNYKYHHAIAVGLIASTISKKMGFPSGEILQIGVAGVLADCGMARIAETITEKAAFLTKEEFNEVKKHVLYSYQMVQATPLLRSELKTAILQHHERLDGSGYPRGIKLEEITIHSQILAVADVFHAMISERVYRSKESPFKVIEMIKQEEFGKFNISVVQALYDLVCKLSIGTIVQLTNGEVGEIIFIHRDSALRPIVKIHADKSNLDLTTNRHLSIQRVIYSS